MSTGVLHPRRHTTSGAMYTELPYIPMAFSPARSRMASPKSAHREPGIEQVNHGVSSVVC